MNLPPVVIVFPTYKRTDYALKSIRGALVNLHYDGDLMWYIADAGSPQGHISAVYNAIVSGGGSVIGSHTDPLTPGANWNRAAHSAFRIGPVYLRLEDDFECYRFADITPYVELLMARYDVGMARLGYLPINLIAETVPHDGRVYLNILKTRQYCYSGNPGLIHIRFHEAYGWYDETLNPGEAELDFDSRVRSMEGPQIWRDSDIPQQSSFAHIGTERSY